MSFRMRPHRNRLMLVTGASGFLGRHLTMASEADGWQLVAPSSAIVDILGRERTISEIREWRPTVVVHLAYRKDDRRVIIEGTRNVAEAAAAAGARLVHMSTDMIFPGRPISYREDDHPFPLTDYGSWKLEAERIVTDLVPNATIVRTSLLYGTDRLAPCQLDVQTACQKPSAMTFFTDEVRCPAFAGDVAAAVSRLATIDPPAGVVHVAGNPVSRADFARHVGRWLGLDPRHLRTGSMVDFGAARPGHVVLDTAKSESFGIRCRPLASVLPVR